MMHELVAEFLTDLVKGQGKSLATARSYRHDLDSLGVFMKEKGLFFTLGSLTDNNLRLFMRWLGEQGYAKSTINRRMNAVRSFCNFLVDYGHLEVSPMCRISLPKPPRSLPRYLTQEEIQRFLSTPIAFYGDEHGDLERRDALAFKVLLWTGLRRSELVNLNVGDIDLEARTLRVRGKGDKERAVPLAAPVYEAISDYLTGSPDLLSPLRWLWKRRNVWERLTIAVISTQVTEKARRLRQLRRQIGGKTRWTMDVDEFFETHPTVCYDKAVWPLAEARDLKTQLDNLLRRTP